MKPIYDNFSKITFDLEESKVMNVPFYRREAKKSRTAPLTGSEVYERLEKYNLRM